MYDVCNISVQNNPDSISGLQPKEIQLNCNKAFRKGIVQLSTVSLTTVSYIILVIKPDPNNLNKVKRICTGL